MNTVALPWGKAAWEWRQPSTSPYKHVCFLWCVIGLGLFYLPVLVLHLPLSLSNSYSLFCVLYVLRSYIYN